MASVWVHFHSSGPGETKASTSKGCSKLWSDQETWREGSLLAKMTNDESSCTESLTFLFLLSTGHPFELSCQLTWIAIEYLKWHVLNVCNSPFTCTYKYGSTRCIYHKHILEGMEGIAAVGDEWLRLNSLQYEYGVQYVAKACWKQANFVVTIGIYILVPSINYPLMKRRSADSSECSEEQHHWLGHLPHFIN